MRKKPAPKSGLTRAEARPAAGALVGSAGNTAFLNVPYDERYEKLYLAFIAGLCGFGLIPRATVEIAGSPRRLDRIVSLIRSCRYSFHDLSRVELDRTPPSTPRFNMPFELGLAIALSKSRPQVHQWFVFESVSHRLNKSLSDLDGSDPYIHGETSDGVLRALTNALSRTDKRPTLRELREVYEDLGAGAWKIKRDWGGSLIEARPFADLVILAGEFARQRITPLKTA